MKYPEVKLTEKCKKGLDSLNPRINVEDDWTFKVRDASGKCLWKIVFGNNFCLGNQRSCSELKNLFKVPTDNNSIGVASKIPLEYRIFYATIKSALDEYNILDYVGIHVGLCFPSDCQETETNIMAEMIFKSEVFQTQKVHGNISFLKTKKLELRKNFFNEIFVQILM